MNYKNLLDLLTQEYDQVQIGTTQGSRCVQKQKGGNGTKQLQIAHLKTDAGEEDVSEEDMAAAKQILSQAAEQGISPEEVIQALADDLGGGEEIHVNYNRVQKKSLWQKLCGWFAGEKPTGNYRKETK